jgi:general secretion pathway protein D
MKYTHFCIKTGLFSLGAWLTLCPLASAQESPGAAELDQPLPGGQTKDPAVLQQEQVSRMEAIMVATRNLSEGKQATAAGDFAKAEKSYLAVLDNLPGTDESTNRIRQQATQGIAQVYAAQARAAQQAGNGPSAATYWQKALTLDPNNLDYQTGLSQAEAKPLDPAVAQRIQAESVTRMERILVLTKNMEEGRKLAEAGDWDKAYQRFKYVYDNSERSESYRELLAGSAANLAALAAVRAQEAASRKDYARALTYWEEALSYAPDNKDYQAAYLQADRQANPLKTRYPGNTAATPELESKVERIQALLVEGDRFLETGQYARARSRYDAVLVIDPNNAAAWKRIEKAEKAKYESANLQYKARREKAMADAEGAWSEKVLPQAEKSNTIVTNETGDGRSTDILDKLQTIKIPELNFNEVDITDAVDYIRQQSKALDPDKKGVNIVLKLEPTVGGGALPAGVTRTLSLNVRNVPLEDVIRYVSSLTGMQYKVEPFAVFILPSTESTEIIQNRTFTGIMAGFFRDAAPPPPPGGANPPSGGAVQSAAVDVKQQLEERGVTFPRGTSASYLPRTNRLVVRNTLDQLDFIDRLISQQQQQTTPQIEIETKFMEFSDDKLKDLSFRLRVNGDTSQLPPPFGANDFLNTNLPAGQSGVSASTDGLRGVNGLVPNTLDSILHDNSGGRIPSTISLAGVIDGSGFRYLISLMESTLGADVMAAPKVVVQSGNAAKIEIVRDFRYPDPDGYEAPTLPEVNGDIGVASGVVIPSTPTSFLLRGVGVTLNILNARAENGLIELRLEPNITDFDGFVNYGEDVTTLGGDSGLDQKTVIAGSLLTPVFSQRIVSTVVKVFDGQTVVMGGLISNEAQQVDDKVPLFGDVPLFGRFFRSKASKNIKKNLVIFVTARLIKPDGTPEVLTQDEQDHRELSRVDQPQ